MLNCCNIIDVISSLPDVYMKGSTSEDKINAMEEELDVTFSEEYRRYILAYSQASYKRVDGSRIDITGYVSPTNGKDVRYQTELLRSIYGSLIKDMYVVISLHPEHGTLLQNCSGDIYSINTEHGINTLQHVAPSLSAVISKDCT